MTGYTVHTGSNEKFSQGWDRIFQGDSTEKQGASTPGKAGGQQAAGKSGKNSAKGAKAKKK